MRDLREEIRFKTSRSGGKGGQNVNKVETRVEGLWNIEKSTLFSEEEKTILMEKLGKRINARGEFTAESQVSRSQLSNKEDVIRKINEAAAKALLKQKKRVATRPTKASAEKRLESKKKLAMIKEGRKKIIK